MSPTPPTRGFRVGVDASNLREGGGLTHIIEILAAADPWSHGISRVVLWANGQLADRVARRPWLDVVHVPMLDGPLPARVRWRSRDLPRLAADKCDLLFVPGGGYIGRFRPFVTMYHNALPFMPAERRRYGVSWMGLRLTLLRHVHARSFRTAAGLIVLNEFARETLRRVVGDIPGRVATIPHGVDPRFSREPKPPRALDACSEQRPFRFLYVSKVDVYKHQWHVAEAVARLRRDGLPVVLDLVGPAYGPALKRLNGTLRRIDPDGAFVRYLGPMSKSELPAVFHAADAFVFASTCENLPNILIEAMAAGLPIACVNRSPMRETAGDAAVYCGDERPESIASALAALAGNPEMRRLCAERAYTRASAYSWTRCARETFTFLAEVAGGRPAGAL